MRQIALPQLLLIDVVIDINGLSSHITSELLNELSGHTCAPEVSREPMPATVWAEVIIHLI